MRRISIRTLAADLYAERLHTADSRRVLALMQRHFACRLTHHGDLAALDGDDADARAVLDVVALHRHRQRQLRRVRQRLRERVKE